MHSYSHWDPPSPPKKKIKKNKKIIKKTPTKTKKETPPKKETKQPWTAKSSSVSAHGISILGRKPEIM